MTIGIGNRCTRPDDYAPSFRLARDAVELMIKLGRQGSIVSAGELGPYGLLLRASSRDDLEAFARGALAPLLEHDRAHGGELVATLRAYLDEDRVQRRVAARCFIHVNTVVYRVHRIEELLGVDLGDPRTVFDLTLALRILDLLADAPVSSPAVARTSSGRSYQRRLGPIIALTRQPTDFEAVASSSRSAVARPDARSSTPAEGLVGGCPLDLPHARRACRGCRRPSATSPSPSAHTRRTRSTADPVRGRFR